MVTRHERERCSEGFIDRLAAPAGKSCVVVCKEGASKVLLNGDAASWLHPVLPRGTNLFLKAPLTQAVYIGECMVRPCCVFVVGEKEVHCEYVRHCDWVSTVTVLSSLSPADQSLLSLALSMKQWAATTLFCARCGGAMHSLDYGMTRDCTMCKHRVYATVAPAIIVAVLDGKGNVIMSERRKSGPALSAEGNRTRLTILAGFVAQGESMEEAVLREVMEETGARVTSLRYVGSQPWPFPFQLMACYYAVADDSPHLVAEESELVQVRWVSREEVREALAGNHGEFVTSPPCTATYVLLEEWASGRVDDWGKPIGHL
ncbi:hypothetical protein LSCM1_07009 [Leishmania martiniquensis]|uniref:NAD(+) diphosphatase n=1 Tax=Leishmania martiniquensis TaxID=1580590 RepID=A0A836H346_9TRYP|nr:hypothetical protein LSCM1_07009 [Leishmania martiniquensis]